MMRIIDMIKVVCGANVGINRVNTKEKYYFYYFFLGLIV